MTASREHTIWSEAENVVPPRKWGTTRFELRMLAQFSLGCDGKPVTLPPAAERLIAYVALHERPVRRCQVARALWTGCPDERRTANLRSALWRVRIIGRDIVDSNAGHLSIGRAITVDTRESVDLIRSITKPSDAGEVDDGQALRWLSSDLLPHWNDEWLVLWQERWRQQRLHGLEAFAQRLASAERYGGAVEAALEAVRGEPLRESAHHCLILVHLKEGNRMEAVRAYHRLVAVLRDELGLRPSEEIRRIISGVLDRRA